MPYKKNKPFNDVMDHMQNIEGHPTTRGGKLPLPIKIIGYFIYVSLGIMLLGALFGNLIFN